MKRLLSAVMVLCCLLLCACGSYRMDDGMTETLPPVESMMPDPVESMMPDPEDGIVEDEDGVIEDDEDQTNVHTPDPGAASRP